MMLGGYIWQFLLNIFRAFSQIIILVLSSKYYTPYEIGNVTLSLSIIGLGYVFSQFGFGVSIIKFKEEDVGRAVATLWPVTIVFSLVIGSIVLLLCNFLAFYYDSEHMLVFMPVIVLAIFFRSLSSIPENICLKKMLIKKMALAELLSILIPMIIVTFAMVWGVGVVSILCFYLIQYLLLLIFYSKLSRFDFLKMKFDKKIIKDSFCFGVGVSFNQLIGYVVVNIDNFFVGKVFGSHLLGIYGRAYQVFVFPATMVGQVISKVSFPLLSNKKVSDKKYLGTVLFFSAVFSAPVTIFFQYNSEVLVQLLFGEDWLEVVPVIQIFSLFMFFRLFYKTLEPLYLNSNKTKELAMINFFNLLIIVSSLSFYTFSSIENVAYVIGISILIYNAISYIFISYKLSLFSWYHILLVALIYAFNYTVFFLISSMFSLNGVFRIGCDIVALGSLFFLFCYIFNKLRNRILI